ncbi:electron transfer flavoprotein subunit beta/FixA family protein [Micrococcoides hystricis]|uniref:Electron transfer flavoprotein subunit beta n=1 Tax=Micrococcoides hystricis TaxID=1572761 RepID=A0ABV6P893_9MICC
MRFVVLVKYAPDTQLDRHIDPATRRVDRAESILSELDEHPIEAALAMSEALGGPKAGHEVIALTMGPDKAVNAVKKALQIGADRGVHLSAEELQGADVTMTAAGLSAAINAIGGADMVLTAMSSTDGQTSLLPPALAATMGLPVLTEAIEVSMPDEDHVQIVRDEDGSFLTIRAQLPAVVSVTDRANEPRYPGFKQIIAAKRKKVQTLGLADVELSQQQVPVSVSLAAPRPERTAGEIFHDEQAGIEAVLTVLEKEQLL